MKGNAMYFLIHLDHNDIVVRQYNREELLETINGTQYKSNVEFLQNINNTERQFWIDNALIVKGEIIVPEPIEIIKGYEIN